MILTQYSGPEVLLKYLRDVRLVDRDLDDSRAHEWPAVALHTPDKPDQLVSILSSMPKIEGRLQKTGSRIIKPGVQVLVRSFDPRKGFNKAEQIRKHLDEELYGAVVEMERNNYALQSAVLNGGVLSLGEEPQTRRHLFTVNCFLTLDELGS